MTKPDTIYFRRDDKKTLEMIIAIATLGGERGDIYHLLKMFKKSRNWARP